MPLPCTCAWSLGQRRHGASPLARAWRPRWPRCGVRHRLLLPSRGHVHAGPGLDAACAKHSGGSAPGARWVRRRASSAWTTSWSAP
jgi:hypothetical protein